MTGCAQITNNYIPTGQGNVTELNEIVAMCMQIHSDALLLSKSDQSDMVDMLAGLAVAAQ